MIIARFRAFLVLITMVFTVTITIILMYIFKKQNRKIRIAWASLHMKLMGIKVQVEGKEDKEANMIMMNHQSIMDILLLEYLSSQDLAWVAKKEIGNIPWFGHILKAPNMIMVERESKSSLVKLIKDAKDRLNDNRKLAIFPEGTRTDGNKLRKFKAGAKVIANKYKLKVQPVLIIKSVDVWDSKRFTQNSGSVKVIYLPTITADKKTTWYEDIEQQMRERLEEELKCKN